MNNILRLSLLFSFILLVTACGTSRVNNFYVLSANSESKTNQPANVAESEPGSEITVGIGPVKVPDYLLRAQIAYSIANNQLVFSSENQWSEPLDKAIARVVAVNLSRLNPKILTSTYPWRADSKPKRSIRLTIIELNRQSDGKAVLVAGWALVDVKTKQILHRAKFSNSIGISEFSYSNLTQAYSDLLATLSTHISERLVNY